MTTLAANTYRHFTLGDDAEFPMIASDIIYQNAAVGLVDGTGLARPLVAKDVFAGFAIAKADNSAGAASAINVNVRRKGVVHRVRRGWYALAYGAQRARGAQ